jgi:hypothetical protein
MFVPTKFSAEIPQSTAFRAWTLRSLKNSNCLRSVIHPTIGGWFAERSSHPEPAVGLNRWPEGTVTLTKVQNSESRIPHDIAFPSRFDFVFGNIQCDFTVVLDYTFEINNMIP